MAMRPEQPYWPFSRRNEIGPGPKGQKNRRADRWRCKCEQKSRDLSICKCASTRTLKSGRPSRAKKTVRIDLRKKREYQRKVYRPWLKRQRGG